MKPESKSVGSFSNIIHKFERKSPHNASIMKSFKKL
jgi:hypothetical protein